MLAYVGPSVVCCLSGGYFLKTEQDWPIVTMEHRKLILLPHSCPSKQPLEKYYGFKFLKNVFKY